MAHILPKTLAKTLSYIGYLAAGEFGLFWDEDGTMPWKAFYWALQQDAELRFVREATMRELEYLGHSLPFLLDGKRLRIRSGVALPQYPPVTPPKRLYLGCTQRSLAYMQESGLAAVQRKHIPLAADRIFAETIAKRRDPEPIIIEVLAERASQEGIVFLSGGSELYLVTVLPPQYLIFPVLPQEKLSQSGKGSTKGSGKRAAESSATPGSFLVRPGHLQEAGQQKEGTSGKGSAKGAKKDDWKREARKVRGKRTV
jgi:putative RNA 2'-phosphotransferase